MSRESTLANKLPAARESAIHKRKRGRKRFAIEIRYTGRTLWLRTSSEKWHVWKRYETEADRDKALACLQAKTWQPGILGGTFAFVNWEFRAS